MKHLQFACSLWDEATALPHLPHPGERYGILEVGGRIFEAHPRGGAMKTLDSRDSLPLACNEECRRG